MMRQLKMTEEEGNKPIRLLIVDQSKKFAGEVKREAAELKEKLGDDSAKAPRPVFTEMVRESQTFLSNREYKYAGLFVNPAVGNPAWLAIIRTAHQYRPGIPVFVIYDETFTGKKDDLVKLGVQGLLKKPLTYNRMLELISGTNSDFEMPIPPGASADASKGSEDPPPSSEEDLVTIELDNIIGSAKSLFDIYVKAGGKFLKILKSGDTLSAERIDAYKKKGATALYVTKKAQAGFLDFYDKMVADMLKDANVSIEVKTTEVSNQGASTVEFLKSSGFSDESLAAAQKYVSNSTELVQQIATKSDAVKNLMNDLASFEHGVACATTAGLVLKHLGAQTPVIYNSIGIACFLHDIALVGKPKELLDEDESKMNPDQIKIYHAHPDEGAKIVKKMKSVPPIVAVAIAQHHLRIHKRGFPKEKLVEEVNLIAELIGLCEEFVKLVKKRESDPSINPPELLKKNGANEFSPAILGAFAKAFAEK